MNTNFYIKFISEDVIDTHFTFCILMDLTSEIISSLRMAHQMTFLGTQSKASPGQ